MSEISRRNFLRGSAAALVVVPLGVSVLPISSPVVFDWTTIFSDAVVYESDKSVALLKARMNEVYAVTRENMARIMYDNVVMPVPWKNLSTGLQLIAEGNDE